MTNTYAPTSEQQACIDAFETGEDLVIEAGAGTGKTSTLRFLAQAAPERKGLFIAFGKKVQEAAETAFDADARSEDRPNNVLCKTTHSLAYGWAAKQWGSGPLQKRLAVRFMDDDDMARILGLPYQGFPEIKGKDDEEADLSTICASIIAGLRRFYQSADTQPDWYHVPRVNGLEEFHREYAERVLPFLLDAWQDIQSKNGRLPFTHDAYLKMWAMTNPTLRFDYIMLDEAQDTNPCMEAVFMAQRAQKVTVGDSCQAIYEWRGAKDTLRNVKGTHRLLLSQSFRFGPAVAEQANKFLSALGSPLKLRGFEQIESECSTVENADCIICRTNAAVISHVMNELAKGRKVYVAKQQVAEIVSFVKAAERLMAGKRVKHPDLSAFKSWEAVVKYSKHEAGMELRMKVTLIENYGCGEILEVLGNVAKKAQDADVEIITAHKAKGLEWPKVLIASDFKAPEPDGDLPSESELKLMYVAVTRAQEVLDAGVFSWIDERMPSVMVES